MALDQYVTTLRLFLFKHMNTPPPGVMGVIEETRSIANVTNMTKNSLPSVQFNGHYYYRLGDP